MMPPKGNEARADGAGRDGRAAASACAPSRALADLLARAEREPLDDAERANLREMRRELAQRRTRCRRRWSRRSRSRRRAASTPGRPSGRPATGPASSPTSARCCAWPARRRSTCADATGPGALRRADGPVRARHDQRRGRSPVRRPADLAARPRRARSASGRRRETVVAPRGPFPKAAQRALSLEVMALLGFDFEAGRLDESAHPFSGGVPEDTRLTTRYREDDFVQSLMGTIHETGHARYEQNLPRDRLGQPVARARSMAIHESQSLSLRDAARPQRRPSSACSRRCSPGTSARSRRSSRRNLQRLMTRVRARPDPGRCRRAHLSGARDPALRHRAAADRRRDRGRRHPGAVGRGHGVAARHRHARQLRQRLHAGRALERRPVRLLPVLHARRAVRGAVVRDDAPRACPISTRASPTATWRRSSTGCATTSGAGQPLDDRRAGDAGERRGAQPVHFRAPPRSALPRTRRRSEAGRQSRRGRRGVLFFSLAARAAAIAAWLRRLLRGARLAAVLADARFFAAAALAAAASRCLGAARRPGRCSASTRSISACTSFADRHAELLQRLGGALLEDRLELVPLLAGLGGDVVGHARHLGS